MKMCKLTVFLTEFKKKTGQFLYVKLIFKYYKNEVV